MRPFNSTSRRRTPRRADEASRDVVAWLKCEYLLDHVEETFDGVINAVTSFGLFVELKDIYIEGLVHVTMLKRDYYHFDAAGQRLVGERTREVYRLGDSVQVRVVRVNLDDRKIDLELLKSYRTEKDSAPMDSLKKEKNKPFAKTGKKTKSKPATKKPAAKPTAKKPAAKKPKPIANNKPAGGKTRK